MNDASDIMAPDEQVSIRRGSEKVTVTELNWKAAKGFLKSLAPHAAEFLTIDAAGKVQVDNGKLMSVLMTGVGEELVMAATGATREWVETLSLTDMTAILDRAVALNLRPEMITAAKNIAGQFRGLMAKATSQTPTTS